MNTPLSVYHEYLECLNKQAWNELGNFVCENVCYNDQEIGLVGYRGSKRISWISRTFISRRNCSWRTHLLSRAD